MRAGLDVGQVQGTHADAERVGHLAFQREWRSSPQRQGRIIEEGLGGDQRLGGHLGLPAAQQGERNEDSEVTQHTHGSVLFRFRS